jgi:hypothetical protein
MNKFHLTRFVSAFIGVLLLFAAFNYYTYLNSEGCRRIADCGYRVGFPFTAYIGGTMLHLDNLIWQGVIENVAAVLAVGLTIGLAAGAVGHKYR